jgi:hypothetical protein
MGRGHLEDLGIDGKDNPKMDLKEIGCELDLFGSG